MGESVFAQLCIGIAEDQLSARIVEIHAATALAGIVERFAERFEVGYATRVLLVERRRPACGSEFGNDSLVPVEQAFTLGLVLCLPSRRGRKSPAPCGPVCDGYRVWHKFDAMSYPRSRKPRPPLDRERLNELALHYVGKYATTRAKLTSYLSRKVRERGWDGAEEPGIERIVQRFAETGLVDDASYALSKSRSLSERGYGGGRVRMALRAAGVDEEDGAAAQELAEEQAVDAAVKFARRRRLGPFADGTSDRKEKERAIGAMVRAGHGFDLARAIVNLSPDGELDLDELRTKCR